MRRPYALTAGIALTLLGCEERGQVIARERTIGEGGAHMGGGGGAHMGGQAGSASGGDPGTRPVFGSPTAVVELNDPAAKDQDPTLTEDQLEIFFFSDRGGNADIWRATRSNADAPWDPPVPVPELNSAEVEQNPAISRDGLRIWFYTKRDPLGIYHAERPSRGDPFGMPEPLPINTVAARPIAPSLDATELRMAVSIGEGPSSDLYELVRSSIAGTWGQPAPLSGVNSATAESTPFLIGDGRELLFMSGRSGGGDLYWAYRESPGLPPIRLEPLSEVNDPVVFDSHPHLTSDRARLYFGSARSGNTDIYVAEAL